MSDEKKTIGPDRIAQLGGLVFGVIVGGYVAVLSMTQNDNSVFGAAIIFLLIGAGAAAFGWKFIEALKAFLSGDLFDDWERVARRHGQTEQARKDAAEAKRAAAKAGRDAAAAAPPAKASAAAPAPEATAEEDGGAQDYDGDGAVEGSDEGVRPAAMTSARDGGADDLKKIKGVGPKLEAQLNGMGFYHFDQIAGWSADEVAWVDANLEGFRGRVSRDGWVEQARLLATGGETEFSKRVDEGDVY
ncbi:MAG: hypothetical protein AAF676_11235 [Pseudomonadota bacterium]